MLTAFHSGPIGVINRIQRFSEVHPSTVLTVTAIDSPDLAVGQSKVLMCISGSSVWSIAYTSSALRQRSLLKQDGKKIGTEKHFPLIVVGIVMYNSSDIRLIPI